MAAASQASFGDFTKVDASSILDGLHEQDDVEMTNADSLQKLIVALDFGTTFSSVAYARITESMPQNGLSLDEVNCVTMYPGDRASSDKRRAWEPREDVPTELWYPPKQSVRGQEADHRSSNTQRVQPDHAMAVDSDSSSDITIMPSDEDEPPAAPSAPIPVNANLTSRPYWGFEVQKELKRADVPKDNMGRIARFKLMLDEENKRTEQIRQDLSRTLRALKYSKQIKKSTDVITEYLLQLFLHTRNELQALEDFSDQTPIEFVLCVPAVWPGKACRIMQEAISAAAQRSGLRSSGNDSLSNLFIISEPEAAAACVLEENDMEIFANETIVILDAGGGTVDATTYEVTNSHPLRLNNEAVNPGTALCGASYINERFEKLLLEKLETETYLVKNGKTIKSIVEAKVIEFENGDKRLIDVKDKTWEMEPVIIDDLKPNSAMGLYLNRLEITNEEMRMLFRDSLKGAGKLLKEQLRMAKKRESSVQKVILIGGFGNSPSLQSYLTKVVNKERNFHGEPIELLKPRIPSTAVARGAVLRAHNKSEGPARITSCSYGFLRTEPYEPDVYPEHKNVRYIIDKTDGERYIDSTIDWLIKKGTLLGNREEIRISVKHTFKYHIKKFICKEELYVSDHLHDSHYRKSHHMNKGAERAGAIEVDMSFLRDDKHIQPSLPSVYSTKRGQNEYHWDVEFDLVMIIEGRNLYYEARWPQSSGMEPSIHQEVRGRGQVCIAAAFKPGTE